MNELKFILTTVLLFLFVSLKAENNKNDLVPLEFVPEKTTRVMMRGMARKGNDPATSTVLSVIDNAISLPPNTFNDIRFDTNFDTVFRIISLIDTVQMEILATTRDTFFKGDVVERAFGIDLITFVKDSFFVQNLEQEMPEELCLLNLTLVLNEVEVTFIQNVNPLIFQTELRTFVGTPIISFPPEKQYFQTANIACNQVNSLALPDIEYYLEDGTLIEEITTIDTLRTGHCPTLVRKTKGIAQVNYQFDTLAHMGILQNPQRLSIDTSFLLYEYIDTFFIETDNTPPTFTYIPPDQTINCGEFATLDITPVAMDDCQNGLQVYHTLNEFDYADGTKIHQFNWVADDLCGNRTTATTVIKELCTNACDEVILTPENGQLIVSNISGSFANLTLYRVGVDDALVKVDYCGPANCGENYTFHNLTTGTYWLDIQIFDAHWNQLCYSQNKVLINNDLVAESPTHGDCSNIHLKAEDGQIRIENADAAVLDIQVYNKDWLEVYKCVNGTCDNPVIIEGLDIGAYNIITKLYDRNEDGSWTYLCERTDAIDILNEAKSRSFDNLDYDFFPNPAGELVYVNLQNYIEKAVTIRLQNVLSKEIWNYHIPTVTTEQQRIDLSNYTNGLYTLSIQSKGRPMLTKKLVIARLY